MQAAAILQESVALRPPTVLEMAEVQMVWAASQDEDEPLGRPSDGWWSIVDWATTIRVLIAGGAVVGVAAVEYRSGAEAAEARVALLPAHRRHRYAVELIHTIIDLARELDAPLVRLYAPAAGRWATQPAEDNEFHLIRTQYVMLRPADAPLRAAQVRPGVQIRALQDGEERALLHALNHAWSATWNFRPIALESLMRDLRGQGAGMFVAVDEAEQGRIVGTCHAIFDPARRNPDGLPYEWISNLTTDPAWRGRGLGRALLTAGLEYLHARGAQSVALGVDGGATIPLALYRSAGFETISAVAIWERPMEAYSRPSCSLHVPKLWHAFTPAHITAVDGGDVDATRAYG